MALSLPYHEPSITTILTQTSFLLALNGVNAVLDVAIYCGLLGQVFIGVAWGAPGAQWLSVEVQEVVVQLGYLGLILIVYEGGLSTSFSSLKANLFLSIGVAVTGILAPIGLSFILSPMLNASPVQSFAAGAALCSTSLGTTFSVLASSGLSSTRLGVVLTSAAMMDDVVGLIMVQIVANLGTTVSAVTIVRPVLVSLAFAVVLPLLARWILKPATIWLNGKRKLSPHGRVNKILKRKEAALVLHTALLLALVAGAAYAGTSVLFTAYLAGVVISWWDVEVPHFEKNEDEPRTVNIVGDEAPETHPAGSREDSSGTAIYESYYHQVVQRILKPLFFASIGFSIPITRMFRGDIVWRGVIYAVLMTFAKLLCGAWLLRFAVPDVVSGNIRRIVSLLRRSALSCWGSDSKPKSSQDSATSRQVSNEQSGKNTNLQSIPVESVAIAEQTDSQEQSGGQSRTQESTITPNTRLSPPKPEESQPTKPVSLYPASIIACAMVARGEIGFLISAVAESQGIFLTSSSGQSSSSGVKRASKPQVESDIFLVVTWAIVLCTIVGPLCVGLLVARLKRLGKGSRGDVDARRDVLGVWGVE